MDFKQTAFRPKINQKFGLKIKITSNIKTIYNKKFKKLFVLLYKAEILIKFRTDYMISDKDTTI